MSPQPTSTTVGFLNPSRGSIPTDFVTTAPAPAFQTFSSDAAVKPKTPAARMVGFRRETPAIHVDILDVNYLSSQVMILPEDYIKRDNKFDVYIFTILCSIRETRKITMQNNQLTNSEKKLPHQKMLITVNEWNNTQVV